MCTVPVYFAVDVNRIILSTALNSFFLAACDRTRQQLVGKYDGYIFLKSMGVIQGYTIAAGFLKYARTQKID